MRVKLLIVLAIAGLLLFFSTGVAMAMNPGCGAGCDCGSGCQCTDNCACANGDPNARCDCAHDSAVPATTSAKPTTVSSVPATVNGVPTAAQLTAAADQQCNACGFPDLSTVGVTDDVGIVPADNIDATILTSPLCGDCGVIPDCSCNEVENNICGPQVNLGCPLITTFAVPVNLNTPAVKATFAPINIAPQVCLGLPQVNLNGVCNNIVCGPVTNINSCPVCTTC